MRNTPLQIKNIQILKYEKGKKMANSVVFKGTVNGIQVVLNEQAPFETIIEEFKEKLEKNKAFFEGAAVNLSFKGRELSQDEQDEIMSMLTNQSILGVSFVHKFGEDSDVKIPEKIVSTTKIEEVLCGQHQLDIKPAKDNTRNATTITIGQYPW